MRVQRKFEIVHPATFAFADLGATVHCGPVAEEFFEELPGLYCNVFATKEWLDSFDCIMPSGVCVLSDPRHIGLFALRGDRLFLLNNASPCSEASSVAPRDVWRVCSALFRVFPRARRLELEIPFAPEELHVPFRTLSAEERYLMDLPATTEEYTASLGPRTRKNLRNYRNRLTRRYPDAYTEVLTPSPEEMERLFAQLVVWVNARMRAKGRISSFEQYPDRRERILAGLIACGATAHVTVIEGQMAAVEFVCCVESSATVIAGGFDQRYTDLSLGFLSTYRAICNSIDVGVRHCNLMRTSSGGYKLRLGARPVRITWAVLLRSELARYWPPLESCKLVYRWLQRRFEREEGGCS